MISRRCTFLRWNTWSVVAMVGAAVAAAGWSPSQPGSGAPRPPDPSKSGAQVVFHVHYDGFGGKPTGLVAAGWDDGLIIFALNPDKPGKDLQAGMITPEQLKHTLEELRSAGFFEEQADQGWGPDMSHTTLTATIDGKEATYHWTEWLSRTWGAHVGADPKFYRFAKMWAISRTALAFASPTDYQPLAKDARAKKRFDVAIATLKWQR
jgi:hypothetical protein